MGLLDIFNTDEGRLGIGLLAAAGPRPVMQSGFGDRLQDAFGAMDAFKQHQLRNKYLEQQMKMGDIGAQKSALELQDLQRQMAEREKAREVMRNFYSQNGIPGAGSSPGRGPGLSPQDQSALPPNLQTGVSVAPMPGYSQQSAAVPPKVDMFTQYRTLAEQYAKAGLVDQAKAAMEAAEKFRPKYNTTPQQLMVNGKLTPVLIAEDGTTRDLNGYEVKPDMVSEDLGGVKQWVDKNAVKPGTMMKKTMTPGEVATNSLGWYNATKPEVKETDDGFVTFTPNGKGGFNTAPVLGKDGQQLFGKGGLTEVQGKATTFAARMRDASKVINELEGKVDPNQVAQSGYKSEFPSWLPGGQILGAGMTALNQSWNPMISDKAQQYRQAQENWVTANLRQESGAAISKDEMEKDVRKWFPQPGDSESVKKQKAQARQVAERAMIAQTGRGAKMIPSIVGNSGLWSIEKVQ